MVVALVVVLPAVLLALRGLGFPLPETLGGLGRPVAGGLLAVVVALGVRGAVGGDFAELALGGTLGLTAYLAVVAPLRHLLPRRPPPEPVRVPADPVVPEALDT
jgi:PST family polysaccharide transporter